MRNHNPFPDRCGPDSVPEGLRGSRKENGSDRRAKPRIVFSRCLGFDHCRYDGNIVEDAFVKELGEYVHCITPCPEADIGMGIPRKPVIVVTQEDKHGMLQPATGKDFTRPMEEYIDSFIAGLGRVHGFVLKSGSPSCGLTDAKFFEESGKPISQRRGAGLFGAAVLKFFRDIPVIDEKRLGDASARTTFLTRIFVMAEFDAVTGKRNFEAVSDFHERHAILLGAIDPSAASGLAAIVAGSSGGTGSRDEVSLYRRTLAGVLARGFARSSFEPALEAILERISGKLAGSGKSTLKSIADSYARGILDESACMEALADLVEESGVEDSMVRSFAMPFPPSLFGARRLHFHETG